jgi:cellulose synthase/poly-beta-1,6-N-acetylglucosamine synthase-like glycosyltransferase
MGISLETILILLFLICLSIISLIALILYNKWANKNLAEYKSKVIEFIGHELNQLNLDKRTIKEVPFLADSQLFLDCYIDYCQIVAHPVVAEKANLYFKLKGTDKRIINRLRSGIKLKRAQAAMQAGYIKLPGIVEALEQQLPKEKDNLVKLYLVESLSKHGAPTSIPLIIDTLFSSKKWYKEKVMGILSGFRQQLFKYLGCHFEDKNPVIHELIIRFAENFPTEDLKTFLLKTANLNSQQCNDLIEKNLASINSEKAKQDFQIGSDELEVIKEMLAKVEKDNFEPTNFDFLIRNDDFSKQIIRTELRKLMGQSNWFEKNYARFSTYFLNNTEKDRYDALLRDLYKYILAQTTKLKIRNNIIEATRTLAKLFPWEIKDEFLSHPELEIRKIAIQSLTKQADETNLAKLDTLLGNPDVQIEVQKVMAEIISQNSSLIEILIDKYVIEESPERRLAYAKVLSSKLIHFFHLLKIISGDEKQKIVSVITALVSGGFTSQIIEFLNTNKDKEIEQELIDLLKNILSAPIIGSPVYTQLLTDFLLNNIDKALEANILNEIEKASSLKFDTSENILDYLENNRFSETSLKILTIVRKNLIIIDLGRYLQSTLLEKLQVLPYKPPRPKREEIIENDKIKILKAIHVAVFTFFPVLYLLNHPEYFTITPILEEIFFLLLIFFFPIVYSLQHAGIMRKLKKWEYWALTAIFLLFWSFNYLADSWNIEMVTFFAQSQLFISDFNYYLIYYSTTTSIVYIGLLVLSFLGVNQQVKYSRLRKNTFLYKDKILPSISIIAPAYAEEESIIESVNSQLNLEYPDFELIVVSDGSPDNTLKVLIDFFELQRVERQIETKIPTQPIRGVYQNLKSFPKLTVIDKANGGKADALNVGINCAKNLYFCGIDSDSLLEPDALIKLASMNLNSDKESIAFGGNIMPINSCKVHKGKLETIHIPKEPLAAFQTIEYLRAFMSGRIGWAYINSLLIISGAFGLFKKDRVIEMGGYLTGKGMYRKDTVGEDMELVVRLNRHMIEQNLPFSSHYCFDANCWTEVPELMKMQQIQPKPKKLKIAGLLTIVLLKIGLLTAKRKQQLVDKISSFLHIPERMRILVNQRDRWHRGLIDILNFHKKMVFRPKYKQSGSLSLPYFLIFETIGPIIEFQGYAMVLFAIPLGLLNIKVAILLLISSILLGIVVSLGSLYIAEKETNIFSKRELGRLMIYAFAENFGPRQIASFWRVKGFFSSMEHPKGWGQMIRKTKPIVLLALLDEGLRQNMANWLEKKDCKVLVCNDGNAALEVIKKENLKCALLQEDLPYINALVLAENARNMQDKKNLPMILMAKSKPDVLNEKYKLFNQVISLGDSDKLIQIETAVDEILKTQSK